MLKFERIKNTIWGLDSIVLFSNRTLYDHNSISKYQFGIDEFLEFKIEYDIRTGNRKSTKGKCIFEVATPTYCYINDTARIHFLVPLPPGSFSHFRLILNDNPVNDVYFKYQGNKVEMVFVPKIQGMNTYFLTGELIDKEGLIRSTTYKIKLDVR
ncbi:hypothetical protein N9I68_01825 [Bacteroidia bacterium]|nr:hypothetical protein [Bacteroidia bacterium]MDB4107477.1 hypothetical protein [Bacteroidia bacterium]